MSLARKLVGPQLLILVVIGALALTQVLVARSERRHVEATTQRSSRSTSPGRIS